MRTEIASLSRSTLCAVAAGAFIAGCGGSQPPISAPGAMPQGRPIATQANRGGSGMAPEAKSGDLLYVSFETSVHVYSYPQLKAQHFLYGFRTALGLCADKAGNVWITDTGAGTIVEYAHGGSKPIATRNNKNRGFISCSVDPRTGNLAVPDDATTRNSRGDVAIYQPGRERPLRYRIPAFNPLYCAYDDRGNLFVNGVNSASALYFGELPYGSSKFISITIPNGVDAVGAMQWDGQYLAVTNNVLSSTTPVYRLSIRGTKARKVGVVRLSADAALSALWIQGSTIIGSSITYADVALWRYPRGGQPVKTIANIPYPEGVAVSLAPH
jgi:hypothetical protein